MTTWAGSPLAAMLVGWWTKDGRFDQRSELDAEQKSLLNALNVAEPARVTTLSL